MKYLRHLPDFIDAMVADGFDLIIVETPGIGQGDSGIVSLVDTCLYVMTSEFGASTQLEKLSILDFADIVAINKFDRKGSVDALRDVQKQMQRNREQFAVAPNTMPVFGTIASHMNDHGLNTLYQQLRNLLVQHGLPHYDKGQTTFGGLKATSPTTLIPESRQRYLGEIAECIRTYHQHVNTQSQYARNLQYFSATRSQLPDDNITSLDRLISDTREHLESALQTIIN